MEILKQIVEAYQDAMRQAMSRGYGAADTSSVTVILVLGGMLLTVASLVTLIVVVALILSFGGA